MKYIDTNTVEFETEEELTQFKTFLKSTENDYLKAKDVMRILDISRETLCHYKSRGLIKTIKLGGQFRYEKESVMNLKKLG